MGESIQRQMEIRDPADRMRRDWRGYLHRQVGFQAVVSDDRCDDRTGKGQFLDRHAGLGRADEIGEIAQAVEP